MFKRRVPIQPPAETPVRRLPECLYLPIALYLDYRSILNGLLPIICPNYSLTQCWDYGWDLYENHYWWEAHEVWERLWKAMPLDSDEQWPNEHPERRFVQGHILLSASRLLEHLGRPHDAMREKAQRYIDIISQLE